MIKSKGIQSLYIHVPFCKKICFYCDFCHVIYQTELVKEWLKQLQIEINEVLELTSLKTIYIGGGTPTSLALEELEELLKMVFPYTRDVEEYTVEVNPESLTKEKVDLLKQYGVNRISMGFQSSQDEILKRIGRNHTYEDTKRAMSYLHEGGFTNISLDLMYSIPGQTLEDLEQSIKDAISLAPTHLSLYSLTIEENTVFSRKSIEPLEDDLEAEMYFKITELLPQYGFQQYEISNFAKEGYHSKHNLCYWNYEDFYGLSSGASGKENNIRYDKPKSLSAYLKNPLERSIIEETKQEQMFNMLMMGLRKKEGLYLPSFENKYQTSFESQYGDIMHRLIQKGDLELVQDYLRCTSSGFPLINNILIEFLD